MSVVHEKDIEITDGTAPRKGADAQPRTNEAHRHNAFQITGVSIWECNFSAVRLRISELRNGGMTDFRAYLRAHPTFVREAIDLVRAVDVNDTSVRMFGASTKADLLGAIGQVWPTEGEEVFAEAMIASVEKRLSFEAEAILRTIDGRRLDVLFSTAFPPEATSRDIFFVTLADITARNQAQAALSKAQADLAHAMRLTSLGELAASIAHEVNQPLAGIVSHGQAGLRWLRGDKPNLDAAITSLERLVEEAKRAGNVIAGIRALAKNELPQPERLSLGQTIEDTLTLLEHELKRSRVDLHTHLDKSLLPVRADRVQIQQVIINLVMNAAQAMMKGEDRRLMVTSATSRNEAVVTIKDSGPGVDHDLRGRLFTAFTTNRAEGMGLGLSICASIVDRYGGRIWSDYDDENGATFRFSLPLDNIGGEECLFLQQA